jgi:hypothetical protein
VSTDGRRHEMTPPAAQEGSFDFSDLAIDDIRETFTPRLGPGDARYIRVLAECYDRLPPILVHRQTLSVIDGVHRLAAARLLGHSKVTVRFFDGSEADAYVEAVRSNVAHGKPLGLAERRQAARSILLLHHEWSDRKVAEICGLSHKTVGAVRKRSCSAGELPQSRQRIGRDDRKRPTDPAALRLRVADLARESPAMSVRRLAARAGTSRSTVLDVRRRLERRDDLLPPRLSPTHPEVAVKPSADRESRSLGDDRACAATSDGRAFVEWFDIHRISEAEALQYLEGIPIGRVYVVADKAREQAAIWQRVAAALEARVVRNRTRRVGT